MNQSNDPHFHVAAAMPWQDLARTAALRAVERLINALCEDGSFGPQHTDIASYYKIPALLLSTGNLRFAHRVLDHVKYTFLLENGALKLSSDALLAQYPAYPLAWIATAAHRLGRFDIGYRCWAQLQHHIHPSLKGTSLLATKTHRLNDPNDDGQGTEMLMSAHLGVAALFFGRLDIALGCGDCLLEFLSQQPQPTRYFYLRMDDTGRLRTDFSNAQQFTHCVDANAKEQGWFFIGYPIAYLSLLYRATAREDFLQGANGYLEFALRAAQLPHEHFAHKVAWGTSMLAELSGDERAWNLCESIVESLLHSQSTDGLWLADQAPPLRYDQSAEVALWLLDIAARRR